MKEPAARWLHVLWCCVNIISSSGVYCCSVQTSSAETLPGAAEEAGSSAVRLCEEHHSEPAERGSASHKGAPSLFAARYFLRYLAPRSSLSARLSEPAGAGRASGAAEGSPSLGAEGAAGSTGAAAEGHRENEEQ